jgi:hypothetical protein
MDSTDFGAGGGDLEGATNTGRGKAATFATELPSSLRNYTTIEVCYIVVSR